MIVVAIIICDVQALEFVRLGDDCVEAYETLMGLFKQAMIVMAPFDHARDGIGLEDLAISKKQSQWSRGSRKKLMPKWMTECQDTTIRLMG